MELGTFFDSEGIEFYREIPASALVITHLEKWERLCRAIGEPQSAIVFLIPYFTGRKTTNLSIYAMPRDYHLFVRALSARFQAAFCGQDTELKAAGFTDSSPIDERSAALAARLGVLGRNGLVLNEKYGSFFFIGEFFLSRALSPARPQKKALCMGCGACEAACPTGAIRDPARERCLSRLTQKKNRTPQEEALVQSAACKWGCDLCQMACPMNRCAAETPIPFFREELVEELNEEILSLGKEEFSKRAFSWRGKALLRRNLSEEE